MIALAPEAQTLLTVVQTVDWLRPPAIAHCRAGFWPRLVTVRFILTWELPITYFADKTFPKKTSSTCSGLISGTRSTAAGSIVSGMVAISAVICQQTHP